MEHKKKIIRSKHTSISFTLLSMPWYPFRYDRQVPLLKGKCKNLHKPGSLYVKCISKKRLVLAILLFSLMQAVNQNEINYMNLRYIRPLQNVMRISY